MRQSDPLFELIHSLRKEEKRHFKLYIKKYERSPKYLALFDAIEQMKVWDEATLKTRLPPVDFFKRLSVAKEYLYSLILRSLRDLEGNTAEAEVLRLIQDSSLLLDRRLYSHARKRILKAEQIAISHEFLGHLYIIRDLKAYLPDISREQSFAEGAELIRSLTELQQCGAFAEDLRVFHESHVFVRTPEDRDELEAIIAKYTFEDLSSVSPRSKIRYHFGLARYYGLIREPENTLLHEIAMAETYEQNSGLIEFEQLGYVLALFNICTLGVMLQRYELIDLYIERARSIKIQPSVQPYYDMLLFRLELIYAIDRKDWYKIEILHHEYPELLSRCSNEVNSFGKDIRLDYSLFFVKAFFLQRKFDRALAEATALLRLPSLALSPYLENIVRIVTLIIHYELDNKAYLPYLVRATYRALIKRDTLLEFEALTIRYLRSIIQVKTKPVIRESFEKLLCELNSLSAQLGDRDFPWRAVFTEWLEWKVRDPAKKD